VDRDALLGAVLEHDPSPADVERDQRRLVAGQDADLALDARA
jgi:hypothetical protein